MAEIVLISPRFDASYWGMEHTMSLVGKRANMPIAALPLLAALTPAEHNITLIDEAVEPLDYDRIAKADIVGLTGMIVQRARMKEILSELKDRGAFVVVGGAWVTVQEDYFGDLADVIFVGEAEETWPLFLQEWAEGRHRPRYEQIQQTDMTRIPVPRFDLMKMDQYLFSSVQFSRGCPFQCEFCDIIVTFGRRPRLKTSEQILAELEALRRQKSRVVFIVDDNLIGNKKAIKPILREIIAYQHKHGIPFVFFTEASLDLAEDDELMQLMVQANIIAVFIGIETPNEDSLKETKKYQNVRPAGTIAERVHRVQKAGMEVWSGIIVGFDNDGPGIFEAQRKMIHETRIINAMVGMLYAIPKTPLHARLKNEGRLDENDPPENGTNVLPQRMSRDELAAGYVRLVAELNHPDAYFDRFEELYLKERLDFRGGIRKYWRRHPWGRLRRQMLNLAAGLILFNRLLKNMTDEPLRREYRRRFRRVLRQRPNPSLILIFAFKCALHYHQYTMSRNMAAQREALGKTMVNSF